MPVRVLLPQIVPVVCVCFPVIFLWWNDLAFLAQANLNDLGYISTNIIPTFMTLSIVLLEDPEALPQVPQTPLAPTESQIPIRGNSTVWALILQ